jgi:hypothetical protein
MSKRLGIFFCSALSILFSLKGFCQVSDVVNQQLIERRLPFYNGLDDPKAIEASLASFQEPIDINKVTREDLLWLGLPDSLISNFFGYKVAYGPFVSRYELATIPGFSPQLANSLRPYLAEPSQVNSNILTRFSKSSSSWLQTRWTSNANNANLYPRQPNNQLLRFRHQFSDGLGFGCLAQQDPGEYYRLNSKQIGPDFISAYVTTGPIGKNISNIIAGDYTISFGHQLLSGTGLSGSASSYFTAPLEPYQVGISHSKSINESGFLRGVAIGRIGCSWVARRIIGCQTSAFDG